MRPWTRAPRVTKVTAIFDPFIILFILSRIQPLASSSTHTPCPDARTYFTFFHSYHTRPVSPLENFTSSTWTLYNFLLVLFCQNCSTFNLHYLSTTRRRINTSSLLVVLPSEFKDFKPSIEFATLLSYLVCHLLFLGHSRHRVAQLSHLVYRQRGPLQVKPS